MQNLFQKVGSRLDQVGSSFDGLFKGGEQEQHSHTHHGIDCGGAHSDEHNGNRYQSFAPQTTGHAKWYVDGCSYFWAVSEALEQARETIYILDWWLSPELYLRRPPAKNEQYRLDRMLQAAAERGVQIRVIVYKEVPQALTLNSLHTKHALEALHPNIRVFRHPDHMPNGHDFQADIHGAFKNLSLQTFDLSKLGKDALQTLYGSADDMVLYWAHHEKLCLIDGRLAFMGGLDMCYGRWDTNSHPIADAHPGHADDIVFPGQDYNNARIYDFADVQKWEENKLDRNKYSRMGWSDISISLNGHIVASLVTHFVDRWNYIYDGKYTNRSEDYAKLQVPLKLHYVPDSVLDTSESLFEGGQRMVSGLQRHLGHGTMGRFFGHDSSNDDDNGDDNDNNETSRGGGGRGGGRHSGQDLQIQLTRSCTAWSAGHPTEHSIANAYIDAILKAEHFVYIENQFFITATSDEQHPVGNKIGRAIVQRIQRAHEQGDDFAMIVCIPAVPGFAGDLKSDGALGTRAIMEFQYGSISRGKHSIYGALMEAGVPDPKQYLRFYNLRNYDRINTTPEMSQTADSVAASYMDGGPALTAQPWDGPEYGPGGEISAYVSEQLYIHSKVLVADDRLVICGSANLNDRSQLGTHDSEIAVVIEDPGHPVETTMAGKSYVASAFAASLRRQLFRKHLGLLPHQAFDRPNQNFSPVNVAPNAYDWDSPADRLVADPLGSDFTRLWQGTAAANTAVFDDVFHCVPSDRARSWADYETYFSQYFTVPGEKEAPKDKKEREAMLEKIKQLEKDHGEGDFFPSPESDGSVPPPESPPPGSEGGGGNGPQKVEYGHVVPGFPGGVEAVKARLAEVRGSLVEMPLDFLVEVKDLAKNGLALNSLTDDLYT